MVAFTSESEKALVRNQKHKNECLSNMFEVQHFCLHISLYKRETIPRIEMISCENKYRNQKRTL